MSDNPSKCRCCVPALYSAPLLPSPLLNSLVRGGCYPHFTQEGTEAQVAALGTEGPGFGAGSGDSRPGPSPNPAGRQVPGQMKVVGLAYLQRGPPYMSGSHVCAQETAPPHADIHAAGPLAGGEHAAAASAQSAFSGLRITKVWPRCHSRFLILRMMAVLQPFCCSPSNFRRLTAITNWFLA